MNLEDIEKNIESFCDEYFDSVEMKLELYLDFLDENRLHIPKENYLLAIDFFLDTFKYLHILDIKFVDPTLQKLYRDINQLLKIKKTIESTNVEQIFQSEFLKFHPAFMRLNQELHLKRRDDLKYIETLKLDLSHIFYEMFTEIFYEHKTTIMMQIKAILNSLTFYFDKLIWINAKRSDLILKHFDDLSYYNQLNSRGYLTHIIEGVHPTSLEYDYLENCLRIYK